MTERPAEYKKALRYDWLTQVYDPLIRWTLREQVFKSHLVDQARIEAGHRVLDLGCGTATLSLLVKARHKDATVIGLDGDEKILATAAAKADRAGLPIGLDQGLSFSLPYADGEFDRILSSLLFHHLTRRDKLRTLGEAWRVLRPGGEIHIADWGQQRSGLMRAAFLLVQALDGVDTTQDNAQGLIPRFLRDTGFADVGETVQYRTIFGALSLYRARKPTGAG